MVFSDPFNLEQQNHDLDIQWEKNYPLLSNYDLSRVAQTDLRDMQSAVTEMLAILEEAAAQEYHILTSILQNPASGSFQEWDHYPAGDVHDRAQGCLWFYHAHSAEEAEMRPWQEHGHFHLFLYSEHFPKEQPPIALPNAPDFEKGGLVHVIAVSFNHQALPIRLFTTNRWVTDEWIYPARDIIQALSQFNLTDQPYELTSRWLTSLLRIYRPQIIWALTARDQIMQEKQNHIENFFENQEVEILSAVEFDLPTQIDAIDRNLMEI